MALAQLFNVALQFEELRAEARAALLRFDNPATGVGTINGKRVVCKGYRRNGKDVFVYYVMGGRTAYRAALAKVQAQATKEVA